MSTIILSHPHSGSTWLRYCIENCTGLQACNGRGQNVMHRKDKTFKYRKGQDIRRVHKINLCKDFDRLIYLTRDPRVLKIRDGKEFIKRGISDPIEEMNKYYDSWNKPKMKIAYEDLFENIEKSLYDVINFIGEPTDKIPEFMKDIDKHRVAARKLYNDNKAGHRAHSITDPYIHLK